MTKKVCAPGLAVLLSAICLTSIASAQTSWWRTYGGTNSEVGAEVRQTTDGGYIIVGTTFSFGAGRADVYLVKTNAWGDTLWVKSYGGTDLDGGNSVQQTVDGGYVVLGTTYSFGAENGQVYLIKTSASGDTLWTRTYGGTGGNGDGGRSVQQTSDGGYIIAGFTDGPHSVYLVKTNASGGTTWTGTYGGAIVDRGSSVEQTTDGGYIVAGTTYLYGPGTPDHGNVYLIKTDPSGDTLWTRTYGGTEEEVGNSVQQTADGGYVVVGYSYSFGAGNRAVYFIKTNAQGDTLWTRTYGGMSKNGEGANSVRQTSDDGYMIVGGTYSLGAGSYDVYLIKTNAQGDTLWTRAYGGPSSDEGSSVQTTTDGGYVVVGTTSSFGAGIADVYLIKTDSLGNVGVAEPPARHPASPTGLLVRPNPFTTFARVPGHETDVFALSDVTGRQVAVCRGDRIGVGLRPGVYFLSPVGPRAGKSATATIVKTAF